MTAQVMPRRKTAFLVVSGVIPVALAFLSLLIGSKGASIVDGVQAIPAAVALASGRTEVTLLIEGGMSQPQAELAAILAQLRLPRALVALTVGAALGAAGAVIQGLTRNPLADAGMLGVSSGAALGVVIGVNVFGAVSGTAAVWTAMGGALCAALLVFGLAQVSALSRSTVGLIITGSALSATLSAFTSGIIYLDPNALDALRFWQTGSVASTSVDDIGQAAIIIAVGAVSAAVLASPLNLIGLGPDTARGLGVNIAAVNALGVAAVTLLAGPATALAGPIGFIGVVVPHLVRRFTGSDYRWVIPGSAAWGSTALVSADTAGRIILPHGELQAGIVVALIGGPLFVLFAINRKAVEL